MTALAWATLPDLPNHRTGVILVGVARCIAMVLIWSNLAGGDMEWCAVLVAVNSIVQLLLFSPVAYFLCVIVGKGENVMVDFWLVTRSVLIFLGVPLAAGIATRFTLRFGLKKWFGPEWYDTKFIPVIGTTSLIGLLFTIVVMFTLQVSSKKKKKKKKTHTHTHTRPVGKTNTESIFFFFRAAPSSKTSPTSSASPSP
jgi:ACR3 family arsenite transporter